MLIGNKKVSQLVPLVPSDVATDDLFLIIDSSVRESKNISAANLIAWLNGSGSVFAAHALLSDTASFVLGSNVYGPVTLATNASSAVSSSWADNAGYAINAGSASNATTASFALNASGLSPTASYLRYSGFPNGTASYALEAQTANTAFTSAYLLYFGGDNGTVWQAIFALSTSFCDTANTASYFNNSVGTVASASYAGYADVAGTSYIANESSLADTASYALVAKNLSSNLLIDYGLTEAQYQSISSSIIQNVNISSSAGGNQKTLIEVIGSAILMFTSSVQNDYSLSLSRFNRLDGEYVLMDTIPISMNVSGSNVTGSLKTSFTLIDQDYLDGEYLIEVSSSSPDLQLDTTRLVKFKISSTSDYVNVSLDGPIEFDVQPSQSVFIAFTSSLTPATVTHDFLPGLLNTGSNTITSMDISNQSVISVKYIWKCTSLNYFNCANNLITELKYNFPLSLSYIDTSHNDLSSLSNFPPSMSYIDCSNNSLSFLDLPLTSSYLNCSDNNLMFLGSLPSGSTVLLADNNNLQDLQFLPDTLISISLDNNNSQALSFSSYVLPSQLTYLSVNNVYVVNLMSVPSGILYLSMNNSNLSSNGIDFITSELVSNGLMNGFLDITANGPPSLAASASINTLILVNNWNVLYDPI